MMSFPTPLVPCDISTGDSSITCTKSPLLSHFDHCDLINAVMPLTTALASEGYV